MKTQRIIFFILLILVLSAVFLFRINVSSTKRDLRKFILNGQNLNTVSEYEGAFTRGSVFFALNELLSDEDRRVREGALMLLLPYKREFSAQKFIKLLDDNIPSIRLAAAIGLGEIRYRKAVLPLSRSLVNEKDWKTASEMAIALGRIGDKRASSYLAEKFQQADDDTLRIALAASLLTLTDDNIYADVLKEILLDGTPERRMRMAIMFAMIDEERLYDLCSIYEESSNEEIRNKAVEFSAWTVGIKKKYSLNSRVNGNE